MKLAIATVDLILAFLAVANLSGCHPVVAEPAAFVITETPLTVSADDQFVDANKKVVAHETPSVSDNADSVAPVSDIPNRQEILDTYPCVPACQCPEGCCCRGLATQAEPKVDNPVGAYFHAPWCGPCQRTSPIVEALQAEGLAIEAINFDERPDLARHYGITALPAFVRYGSPYSTRWVGAYGREQIAAMFGHSIDTSPRSVERLDTSGQVLTNSHVVRGGCPHAVEIAGQWRAARGPVPWVPPEATAHKSVAERGDLDTGATAHFYER